MNDNQLSATIRTHLLTMLEANGFDGRVIASYQPTSQGREPRAHIGYFHLGPDQLLGHPLRHNQYDAELKEFVHTEKQWVVATFQFWALAKQDPRNTSELTAKDLLHLTASILNSDAFRQQMKGYGIGTYKPASIRNPTFINESLEYEASPSFDFQVSYQRSIVSRIPAVKAVEYKIHRV